MINNGAIMLRLWSIPDPDTGAIFIFEALLWVKVMVVTRIYMISKIILLINRTIV